MIRDLVRWGDPRLLAPNADADAGAPGFRDLLDDMVATCHAAPGIGLAAPQIGVNLRVAVIDLSVGSRPDGVVVRHPDVPTRFLDDGVRQPGRGAAQP